MSCFDREIKYPQGSDEWLESRMGILTGSVVADIIKGSRGAYPASREKLLLRKAIEYLCGVDESPDIPEKFADWGTEHEPEACQLLASHQLLKGKELKEVGLIKSDFHELVGSSVDRITSDGSIVVEVKCPFYMSSHISHIINRPVINLESDTQSKSYYWQIRHHMLVTGAEIGIWASYHHKFTPNQLHVEIIQRNEAELEMLKNECILFVEEMRTLAKQLINGGKK